MHRRRTDARPGFSLLEVVAALGIGGLLCAVLLGMLTAQLRLARAVADQAVRTDAARTAAAVLSGEARRARPEDVRALGPDSLELRLFRGTGIVCATAASAVRVRYRGDRLPDAGKDSVLLVSADVARAAALLDARAAAPGACAAQPGEVLLELTLDPPTGSGSVVLIFEGGTYYLTGRALRYRLGAEGRQPLTNEAFVHPRTRFAPATAYGLHFDLATAPAAPRSFAAPFGLQ